MTPILVAFTMTIAGWVATPGITESQAAQRTEAAIADFFATSDEGDFCGVQEIWSLEREMSVSPLPQMGELFAVTAYARAPMHGCSTSAVYDCRVVFRLPPQETQWRVESTDCEPTGPQDGD